MSELNLAKFVRVVPVGKNTSVETPLKTEMRGPAYVHDRHDRALHRWQEQQGEALCHYQILKLLHSGFPMLPCTTLGASDLSRQKAAPDSRGERVPYRVSPHDGR